VIWASEKEKYFFPGCLTGILNLSPSGKSVVGKCRHINRLIEFWPRHRVREPWLKNLSPAPSATPLDGANIRTINVRRMVSDVAYFVEVPFYCVEIANTIKHQSL